MELIVRNLLNFKLLGWLNVDSRIKFFIWSKTRAFPQSFNERIIIELKNLLCMIAGNKDKKLLVI